MIGLLAASLAAALIGACIGSFIATLAVRAPEGWAGMWTGRSRCPSCHATLSAAELVPLVSWIRQCGRCRSCGATIHVWYPLVELAAAGIGLVSVALVPWPEGGVVALLGWWLLALAAIDLVVWLLPDALTLPLLAAGLLIALAGADVSPLWPPVSPLSAVLGAALGYLALAGLAAAYRRLRGREGLGLGDAKLLAAAGAWLGVERLPAVLLAAALLGLLTAVLRRGPMRAETAVPFGPALALAFWGAYLMAAAL